MKATLAVVHFRLGCICMAPAILSVIAFLALFVWRFVFKGLQRRPAVREIGVPRQQDKTFLEQGLHILQRAGVIIVGGNRSDHASDGVGPAGPKDRPKTYLLRIVALTGATQMGNGYDINVGTTRFHVRDRYVGRPRDVNNPKGAYEETCFYSAEKHAESRANCYRAAATQEQSSVV